MKETHAPIIPLLIVTLSFFGQIQPMAKETTKTMSLEYLEGISIEDIPPTVTLESHFTQQHFDAVLPHDFALYLSDRRDTDRSHLVPSVRESLATRSEERSKASSSSATAQEDKQIDTDSKSYTSKVPRRMSPHADNPHAPTRFQTFKIGRSYDPKAGWILDRSTGYHGPPRPIDFAKLKEEQRAKQMHSQFLSEAAAVLSDSATQEQIEQCIVKSHHSTEIRQLQDYNEPHNSDH